jgi:HNH endonuclease/NUMOD4 motif
MSDTRWKVIPGFSHYDVSEYGDVRRNTRAPTRRAGHILRGTLNRGYRKYVIVADDGRKKQVPAHTLVLLAFVGPRPLGHECAHYDGKRSNNHLSNLRWTTPTGNGGDRARHGSLKGERNGCSKLSFQQVQEIRASMMTGPKLAAIYGVSRTTIWAIKQGETWRHVEAAS